MKLLIVDDSKIIRNMIQNDLKDFNIEIVGTASDGLEAIQKFDELRPDVVTLDITMKEVDGLMCLEQMLKINPKAQIIMITALSDKTTVLKALKDGAKAYLIKPFKSEKLIEILKNINLL